MNHPGATLFKRDNGDASAGRTRLVMLIAAIAAFALWLPAGASANVTPTASTVFGSDVPGAAGDYTINQDFVYDSGPEPVAGTEDLKKWVVDSPAGMVGNPNAIPYADRCDPTAFDPSGTMSALNTTGACPASSKVGEAKVYLVNDADSGACPAAPPTCISGGFDMYLLSGSPLTGNIYILKTDPEVPTTLGTIFTNSRAYQAVVGTMTTPVDGSGCAFPVGCALQPKTKSIIQPVTSGDDGDFRLRTIPHAYSTAPVVYLPSPPHGAFPGGTPLHYRRIEQKLFGLAANGNAFMSNPTNCGTWKSYSYGRAIGTNAGTTTDVDFENPSDAYAKSAADDHAPNCATLPTYAPSGTMALNSYERGNNPESTFTVNGIGAYGNDYPKKTVTTLPPSINIDVANLPPVCEVAQRDTNSCPATSKVGTAQVTTPMITAGLSGDVYIIRGAGGKAIPDLSIFFNNPPNSIRPFRMDATTQFVGPNNNQIETTFDNGPQNPWTSFKLTFTGGTGGLLKTLECPDAPTTPDYGSTTFSMTGFSGQTAADSVTPPLKDCWGLGKLKKVTKCVRSNLRIKPSLQSRSMIKRTELWIKRKGTKKYRRITTSKKSPFWLNGKVRSRTYTNRRQHLYKVRAVYGPSAADSNGAIFVRNAAFKKC